MAIPSGGTLSQHYKKGKLKYIPGKRYVTNWLRVNPHSETPPWELAQTAETHPHSSHWMSLPVKGSHSSEVMPPKCLASSRVLKAHGIQQAWPLSSYPLHVSFEQSKYSSDAWFHHEQWLNNQHSSLLGRGRHEGLNPKAVRSPLLHFPMQPLQQFPLSAAGSSPCLSCVLWLSSFCSLENWELGYLWFVFLTPPILNFCSWTWNSSLSECRFLFVFCKNNTLPLRKEILSFPSLWFFSFAFLSWRMFFLNSEHHRNISEV